MTHKATPEEVIKLLEDENKVLKLKIVNLNEIIKYENSDYDRAKQIVDMIIGYFHLKFENAKFAEKTIKLLTELKELIKKNMKEVK